ncbi:hypothetical protein BU23DRAFT_582818 [Bimuria novae-zelandiae CBS 107.79]|uniref:C2H2-type domain-containing protein n=1 Tax=Bimuria novae-zelandiae CBS 107.79 TaxID=1447943 RepID=A0A6A5UVI7_9PLEO|nr:hypothetical protein BU23DRAFT_582818 [Bimuria novae-zelandiae CBS 107.79]
MSTVPADIVGVNRACADTGSEENIISHKLAQTLGNSDYDEVPDRKQFILAKGKVIEAIDMAEAMTCIFYVLMKLTSPLIMGMGFLKDTKVLTEHRGRLVRVPRSGGLDISVLATPNTGSEIDLMTRQFASERGLFIQSATEMIEFADGSTAITSGFVQAKLDVIEGVGVDVSPTRSITVDFLLLDNLIHDVLLGEVSLEGLCVFTEHRASLYPVSDATGPLGLNRIRYLGAIDRTVAWVKEKLGIRGQQSMGTTLTAQSHNDQHENYRREVEAARIAALSENEQETAIAAEAERQAEYKARTMAGFKCDFLGCNAAPCPTQYLLSSHANVHSQSCPHYCPVAGCRRAEGGKGFKRKNEMIQHQLMHLSPGYICPFCPDREHKYPRPDNFKRHVHVHHVDVAKDDPKLLKVLAQRPESDSRSLWKRLKSEKRDPGSLR